LSPGCRLGTEPFAIPGFGHTVIYQGYPATTNTCGTTSSSRRANYVLGLAGQYAAATRLLARDTDRSAFLATVAARWAQLDPTQYPFVHQVAAQLPGHDDREQFLAGIDLILAGITTVR
jgi:hypothetical protein